MCGSWIDFPQCRSSQDHSDTDTRLSSQPAMHSSDVGEAVLPLVLRNCPPLSWSTICRLLSTSKAAVDAVHSSCAGFMKLDLTPRTGGVRRDLEHWLSKHVVLLRILRHVEDSRPRADSTTGLLGGEELAAAWARAAALPSGLMLRLLQTSSLSVKALHGSCSTLTCLDLSLSEEMLFPIAEDAVACITGLRGHLSSLILHADWTLFDSTDGSASFRGQRITKPGCGLHSLLAQCLPQLTALTRLVVDEVADTAILKHAPPQLVELAAVGCDDQSKSVLELGHLTACTNLGLLRNPENKQEGWRVVHANDTLPPNLRRLQVVDCTSATPLLALTQLTGLTITEHCDMPAAELRRLSSLTQLEHVHLGYDIFAGGGGEEAAQQGSAGWDFVPGLQSLELHHSEIDPACDLLQHLAACTSLTRLVWDTTFLTTRGIAFRLALAGDELPEHFTAYRDGGLGALGGALPASLKVVRFENFLYLPEPDDDGGSLGGSDEAAMVLGLYYLRCDIDALPHLQSCIMQDDNYEGAVSEAGQELIGKILRGEGDYKEPEAFFNAHAEAYPHFYSSDADDDPDGDDEGSSDDVGESSSDGEGSSESEEGAGAIGG